MTESVPKAIAAPPTRATQTTRAVRNLFLHNVGLKFLSLLAAFALWLFVNGGARDSESALQISLQLQNLPGHLMIGCPCL